jgi:hypothetical protein
MEIARRQTEAMWVVQWGAVEVNRGVGRRRLVWEMKMWLWYLSKVERWCRNR